MQTSRTATAQPQKPLSKTAAFKSKHSKKEQLIALLRAKGGADIDQLTKALGWLPHTVRDALSGVRKSGLAVERINPSDGRPTRYRITTRSARV